MKIRVFSKLQNGIYNVTIATQDWSDGDKQLMLKYAEPTIDLGGEFVSDTPYLEFTLSNKLVLVMSESPFTQRFDSRDYADADERATCWKSEIVDRITVAVVEMRELYDTFTREEVTDL
jgi:hypothetical protein